MSLNARLVRPSSMRVRAPRVPVDLMVESRTIGTNASYKFTTIDISRSGLLLSWQRDTKMPFIVNTLLELTIDPKGDCLDKPVACLGKVVRREANDEDDTGKTMTLGIQIVQIDNTDLAQWEGCLSQLERQFGIELSNKIVPA